MNFTVNDRAIDFVLTDRRDFTLTEGKISFKINAVATADGYRLLEDGEYRLLEDGSIRLLE